MTIDELMPYIGKNITLEFEGRCGLFDGKLGTKKLTATVFMLEGRKSGNLKWFYAEDVHAVKWVFDEDEKSEVEPKKPPLGLRPKFVVNGQRRAEIIAAVQRYGEAGWKIPQEWIDEYNSLCEK